MPVLSVMKLVAYRHGDPLFCQANFTLELGDCMMLTAGNGVGKTTLLDCVAGLYHDWSGTILKPKGQVSYFQQTSQYVRTLPFESCASRRGLR